MDGIFSDARFHKEALTKLREKMDTLSVSVQAEQKQFSEDVKRILQWLCNRMGAYVEIIDGGHSEHRDHRIWKSRIWADLCTEKYRASDGWRNTIPIATAWSRKTISF